jgi:uncharacterized protein (DUF4415 family)
LNGIFALKKSEINWNKLMEKDDSEIDYSDIPSTDQKFWEDAEILYPRKKVTIHLKVDEDIAKWLVEMADRSDSAVNSLLRSYFIGMNNLPD